MNRITKSILSKIIWIAAAFVAFFFIGDSLGIIPQNVKDTFQWGAANFNALTFLICFLAVVYLIAKFLDRGRRRE